MEFHHRVVVNKVVELSGSHAETGNDLFGMKYLLSIGNDSLLHQVQVSVGEHVCVYTEIFLVSQRIEGCVGNAANTGTYCGSILYKLCHVFADLVRSFVH